MIYSDNSTTVFYINKLGGTHSSKLCKLSLELWQTLLFNYAQCLASHITGKLDVFADQMSRSQTDRHDYFINRETFNAILELTIVTTSFDLFASGTTHKLSRYASLIPDSKACKIYSFPFHLHANLYIFPPLPLLSLIVQKIKFDESEAIILIIPAWPGLVSFAYNIVFTYIRSYFYTLHHLLGQAPTIKVPLQHDSVEYLHQCGKDRELSKEACIALSSCISKGTLACFQRTWQKICKYV